MVISDDMSVQLVVLALAAVAAPLLVDRLERWVRLPSVVVEVVLGIVIGPQVLGLVGTGVLLETVSQLGMAMLFFLAGYEIDFRAVRGRPIAVAGAGWLVSFAVAAGVLALAGAGSAVLIVAIGLCSTALGTILPIARDSGLLAGPVGPHLMAVGAVGEFAPIALLALFYSEGHHSGRTTLVIALVGLAVAAAAFGSLRRSARVSRLLSATMGTSAQLAVRLSVLVLLASVLLAAEIGVDIALGAFAAGVVMHVLLAALSEREEELVRSKLDGIGFGAVVPVFFVYTGVTFDLDALVSSPVALALIPVFLGAFVLVRGVVTFVFAGRVLAGGSRRALGAFAATQLPIVVIASATAADRGLVSASVAAAMVGAAMVSVLVFPLVGLRWAGKDTAAVAAEPI
ncbi:cation:proton antiporter [Glycomyces harbinensis]|uniref:Kef-type K+ transport system, membrane component KefB n=1 Tax=Glycomyces harbinensis TaxID=58114 RepID=A0A1G6RCZ3_9ACTN|nr:cation:proton antiporter [Glycomyces harbinensis]SDD02408.1 Kef-type K+ transport system, membrane component KefB [Glycomyces harbinensis]